MSATASNQFNLAIADSLIQGFRLARAFPEQTAPSKEDISECRREHRSFYKALAAAVTEYDERAERLES